MIEKVLPSHRPAIYYQSEETIDLWGRLGRKESTKSHMKISQIILQETKISLSWPVSEIWNCSGKKYESIKHTGVPSPPSHIQINNFIMTYDRGVTLLSAQQSSIFGHISWRIHQIFDILNRTQINHQILRIFGVVLFGIKVFTTLSTSNIFKYLLGTRSQVDFSLCTAEWSRPLRKKIGITKINNMMGAGFRLLFTNSKNQNFMQVWRKYEWSRYLRITGPIRS